MNDDAIELAARAVAKIEAEHFGRDLTEADWQAGRLMWRKAVAPLVEQLRQAEVSRDAYREEMRGAKEALGDHLADSREDHLDTRIALAAERESRFRWAEEAAHVTNAAKALLDMEYATASDNRMAWSAWPIEYNDLAVAIGWRGAKRPGDYTLDDLTMAPADRTQMEAERDTALAEIERLRDTLTEQVDATVTQGWEAVGAEYERTAAETEADRLRANLAALRASAVVLPEPVQRLVDWHQSFAGPHVSPMPFQSEVREAMESWRPATVEAAPTQRFDLFIGGPKSGTIEPVSEGISLAETRTGTDWCPRCHEEAGTNRNSHGGVERCAFCWSPLVEHEPSDAAGVSGTGTEASDAQ